MRVARAPLAPRGGYDVPCRRRAPDGSRASTPPGTCETRRRRRGERSAVRTSAAWPAIQQAANTTRARGPRSSTPQRYLQRTPPTADLRLVSARHATIHFRRAVALSSRLARPRRRMRGGQRRAAARTLRRRWSLAPKVAHDAMGPDGTAAAQPPLEAASAAPRPPDAPLSTAPVGHLEGPHHLTHLFEALAKLDDGHAHDDVRILQYGDSHTASDLGVAVFRRDAAGTLRRRRARLRVDRQAVEGLRAGRHPRRHDEGVRADEGQVPQGPDLHRRRRLLRPARRRHRGVVGGCARLDATSWRTPRTSSSTTARTRAAGASTSSSTARVPGASRRARPPRARGGSRSTWRTRRTRSSSGPWATAKCASSG